MKYFYICVAEIETEDDSWVKKPKLRVYGYDHLKYKDSISIVKKDGSLEELLPIRYQIDKNGGEA